MPEGNANQGEALSTYIDCASRDTGEMLSLAFYRQEPRNVLSGVLRGCSNVLMGAGLGVSAGGSLLVNGYRQSRLLSMCLYSLATLTASVAAGGAMGAHQAVMGAVNTMRGIKHSLSNPSVMWDETLARWVAVDLQAALRDLPAGDDDLDQAARETYAAVHQADEDSTGESGEQTAKTTKASRDTALYDILEVQPTATQAEITRAFRAKALVLHPDKCGCTPAATENFRRLNEAYQVLSKPSLREEYDRLPPGATQVNTEQMSLFENIAMPFAEPLIGPLQVLLFLKPYHFYTAELRRRVQHRKELRVAQQLTRFLDEDCSGDVQRIIQDTYASHCGPSIVQWIVEEYRAVCRQHAMPRPLRHALEALTVNGGVSQSLRVVWNVWRTFHGGAQGDARDIPSMLCEQNIRQTVRQAAQMTLHDRSVSSSVRVARRMKLELLALMMDELNNQQQ